MHNNVLQDLRWCHKVVARLYTIIPARNLPLHASQLLQVEGHLGHLHYLKQLLPSELPVLSRLSVGHQGALES